MHLYQACYQHILQVPNNLKVNKGHADFSLNFWRGEVIKWIEVIFTTTSAIAINADGDYSWDAPEVLMSKAGYVHMSQVI